MACMRCQIKRSTRLPSGVANVVPSWTLGHITVMRHHRGLIAHLLYSEDVSVLDNVLKMHTALQVHRSVPRTYSLQISCADSKYGVKQSSAVYVGESPGEWNLGRAEGYTSPRQDYSKKLLVDHVTQCLIRMQILTISGSP